MKDKSGKKSKSAVNRAKKAAAKLAEKGKTGPDRKGTVYQPIIDKMAKCKAHGEEVFVETPKDTTIQQQQNRLNTIMRRYAPPAPKGFEWIKRADEIRGGVRIVLVTAGTSAKVSGKTLGKSKARKGKKKAKRAARGNRKSVKPRKPKSHAKASKRKAPASRKKVSKPTKRSGKSRPAKKAPAAKSSGDNASQPTGFAASA